MDFEASSAVCKNANMKLVELETKEEFDAILKLFDDKEDLLYSYHYLGAQANNLNEWKWINGGKFAYEMHLDAFDSDEEEEEVPCVQYSKSSSKYFTYRCSDIVPQVICEKDDIASEDNESTAESAEIADDFKKIGEFGMKFKIIKNII
jgi:hypothetical protein